MIQPKLPGIIPVRLQINPKPGVLLGNGVLANVRETEKHQDRAEDTQTAAHIEGILRRQSLRVAARGDDVRENICAHKSADLAHGGRDAVILTPDSRRARLGGDQANVVARAELAQGDEDAVDGGEGADHGRLGEPRVEAGHEEADEGLEGGSQGEGVARAEEVRHGGAEHGTRDVEQVDDGVPAEDGRQRGVCWVDA